MLGKAIKSSKRMPHSNTCTQFIEMSEKSIVEKSHPCKKYKMQSIGNICIRKKVFISVKSLVFFWIVPKNTLIEFSDYLLS